MLKRRHVMGRLLAQKSAVKVPLGNFWELKTQLSSSYSSGAAEYETAVVLAISQVHMYSIMLQSRVLQRKNKPCKMQL